MRVQAQSMLKACVHTPLKVGLPEPGLHVTSPAYLGHRHVTIRRQYRYAPFCDALSPNCLKCQLHTGPTRDHLTRNSEAAGRRYAQSNSHRCADHTDGDRDELS